MNGLLELQRDNLKLFIGLPYDAWKCVINGLIAHTIMNHKYFGKDEDSGNVSAKALFLP